MTPAGEASGGGRGQPSVKLPPAYRLVELDSVGSTMQEARQRAEEGAEDGTLVWAKEQTEGRGRQGRNWASPRGNLYLSLILRPECSPATAAQLSFLAAVALGEAVGSVAPPMVEVTFKWPNDVLFNSRKGAGILLESSSAPDGGIDYVILGMGVNVQSHPEDAAYPSTSLRFEGCPPQLTEVQLLEAFGRSFLSRANTWLEEGFVPIRKAWLAHAANLGKEIEVRLPKETLTGTFEALDEQGVLLLRLADGSLKRIAAGDVYPLG